MAQLTMAQARERKSALQAAENVATQTNGIPHGDEYKGHPGGPIQHGGPMQAVRIVLFTLYFLTSCLFIHGAQLLGSPLYFYDRDYFYAYMALTKQYFGLFITTLTHWWSPTVVRISGDASITGQLRQRVDGRLECHFPDRLILLANHQIYTDWLYLWWTAYTQGLHGHMYIILKESLKWVPVIGPAMQFYGFVFMARKWASDQARLRYRLQKLSTRHSGPLSGSQGAAQLDPMWLLIFPEGTNLSANTRKSSTKWAEQSGVQDLRHCLLPRSTGLQFCLQELNNTAEYVYDCTIAYEGIPHGEFGQDIFTLRSVYFQGRPPKSVNMHWRRFPVSEIPYQDPKAMEEWTLKRWREKDAMLEMFLQTGRFPADPLAIKDMGKRIMTGFIETEVRPKYFFEIFQMFAPMLGAALVVNVLIKLVHFATSGTFSGK